MGWERFVRAGPGPSQGCTPRDMCAVSAPSLRAVQGWDGFQCTTHLPSEPLLRVCCTFNAWLSRSARIELPLDPFADASLGSQGVKQHLNASLTLGRAACRSRNARQPQQPQAGKSTAHSDRQTDSHESRLSCWCKTHWSDKSGFILGMRKEKGRLQEELAPSNQGNHEQRLDSAGHPPWADHGLLGRSSQEWR